MSGQKIFGCLSGCGPTEEPEFRQEDLEFQERSTKAEMMAVQAQEAFVVTYMRGHTTVPRRGIPSLEELEPLPQAWPSAAETTDASPGKHV